MNVGSVVARHQKVEDRMPFNDQESFHAGETPFRHFESLPHPARPAFGLPAPPRFLAFRKTFQESTEQLPACRFDRCEGPDGKQGRQGEPAVCRSALRRSATRLSGLSAVPERCRRAETDQKANDSRAFHESRCDIATAWIQEVLKRFKARRLRENTRKE